MSDIKKPILTQFASVAEARQAGVKVNVRHHRLIDKRYDVAYNSWKKATMPTKLHWTQMLKQSYLDTSIPDKRRIYAKGGVTQVHILHQGLATYGCSVCSIADNYNRKEGVKRALRRAIEAWNEAV